jgi:ribulose 1,5-bisphosphate synthetase/thiazole synthase
MNSGWSCAVLQRDEKRMSERMIASKTYNWMDLIGLVRLRRNGWLIFRFLLLFVACGGSAWAFSPAEKPDAPATIETAYTGPGSITVYWSPPSGGGSTGYRLFRDEKLIASPTADARSFREMNLPPGAAYHYRVEATYADKPASISHTITEKLPPLLPETAHYDVVIVMASSAGVAAAVTAARKGLHVALLEPTDRLGGIMSNGLCATDMRRAYHSTGFFEEFRQHVQQYYGSGEGMQYEPHVVNNVLKEMVGSQPNIDIFYHVRAVGTRVRGNTVRGVQAISTDNNAHTLLLAPMTIDADPTGDVTAWAGCRCRVGREKRTPEEPHAGVIHYARAKDILLPGSTGHGDRRIQAYTYLCVVKDYGEGADRRIPKPLGYKESEYIHGPSWKDSWAVTSGAMPGNKYELNQHPQGNDLQEINYHWPWEGQKGRQRIEAAFRNHPAGRPDSQA